ncbi:MAG: hypothetical protein GY909_15470 [Oligoflexia bacterium]|nr:hypothetical protein [Oligoflexia bacterium]
MLLVIIPIEFALSLFLFQRHSPIYWLRTFHFLTTESILNSSWDDNQTLHLSDVLDSEVYNSGNSLEDLDL